MINKKLSTLSLLILISSTIHGMKRKHVDSQTPEAKRPCYEKENISNEDLKEAAIFWTKFDIIQEKLSGNLAPIQNPTKLKLLQQARINLNYFEAMPTEIKIKIIQQLLKNTIHPKQLIYTLIRLQQTSKSLNKLIYNNHNIYESIRNYTLIYPIKSQATKLTKLFIFTELLQVINYSTQEEQIVEILYDIQQEAYSKTTALDLSSYLLRWNYINLPTLNKNQRLFRYLIRKFDPKSISDYLFNEIKTYTQLNIIDIVITLFINLDIEVNKYDDDGKTILIYAAQNSNLIKPRLIENLLKLKADLDFQDTRGYTALMHNVISTNQTENSYLICQMLLSAGANPNIINRQGKTALDLVVSPSKMLPVYSPNQENNIEQQIIIVQYILKSNLATCLVIQHALGQTRDPKIIKILTNHLSCCFNISSSIKIPCVFPRIHPGRR